MRALLISGRVHSQEWLCYCFIAAWVAHLLFWLGSPTSGEVSEWLKEHAWKACVGETQPWVRIPPSPPFFLFCFHLVCELTLSVYLWCTLPLEERHGISQPSASYFGLRLLLELSNPG